MKYSKIKGRRGCLIPPDGKWVKRDTALGRYIHSRRQSASPSLKRSKASSGLIQVGVPVVYSGPSFEGKRMRLVEVVSGKVEDRKPSFT